LPLALLAGTVLKDEGGWKGTLARLGVNVGMAAVFLSYSRKAESQADSLPPRSSTTPATTRRARCASSRRWRAAPARALEARELLRLPSLAGNRREQTAAEVARLGAPAGEPVRTTRAFERMKRRLEDCRRRAATARATGPPGPSRDTAAVPPARRWRIASAATGPATARTGSRCRATGGPRDTRDGQPDRGSAAGARGDPGGHHPRAHRPPAGRTSEAGRRGLRPRFDRELDDLLADQRHLEEERGSRGRPGWGRGGDRDYLAARSRADAIATASGSGDAGAGTGRALHEAALVIAFAPERDWERLAPVFDRILDSLRLR